MKTILVVDGDSRVRNIVRLLFTENKGYRVITLTSGEEALTKTWEVEPDLVVADINLDDGDGYKLSKEIKSDVYLAHIPVLLLNSGFDALDANKVIESGADDILTKPFGIEVVNQFERLIKESKRRKKGVRPSSQVDRIFARILPGEGYVRTLLKRARYYGHKVRPFTGQVARKETENFGGKRSASLDALKITLNRLRNIKAQSDPESATKARIQSFLLDRRGIALICLALIIPLVFVIVSNGGKDGRISSVFHSLKPTKGYTLPEAEIQRKAPEPDISQSRAEPISDDGVEQNGLASAIEETEAEEEVDANNSESSAPELWTVEKATEKRGVAIVEPENLQVEQASIKIPMEEEPPKIVRAETHELNGSKYKVKKGDTILGIAKKFNTSPKKLKDWNDINGDKIRIGELLVVSYGIEEEKPKERVVSTEKKEETEKVDQGSDGLTGGRYTVKRGDNLYRISARLGTSVKELKALNNLKSDKIRIGQLLAVPVKEEVIPQPIKTVKKKDEPPPIQIGKSSFYTPLAGMPVQTLILENKGSTAYRDIRVKIRYYSSSGTEMGSEIINIPVVILPYSQKSYIKEGVSIKTDPSAIYNSNVEILGATPLSLPESQVKLDY